MRYRFLRYPDGREKAVTFSFDDGCRQDIRLAQTLDRYGIKCTFNLNSCNLENSDGEHISVEEIQKYILDAGHEVAVHGRYHSAPGLSRPVDAIQEVLTCRLEFEKAFGRIIRGMAYPDTGITIFQNGASYENVRRYLQDLDIVYARTLGCDNNDFRLPADWYAWMPTAHQANPQVFAYAKEFMELDLNASYSSRRYPRLFYLWGHSYEFTDNWEHLEQLCQALAGRSEIWYATNMEIYNYVEAYNRLIFSADGSKVYNPTLLTVWFEQDKKLYCVQSGASATIS